MTTDIVPSEVALAQLELFQSCVDCCRETIKANPMLSDEGKAELSNQSVRIYDTWELLLGRAYGIQDASDALIFDDEAAHAEPIKTKSIRSELLLGRLQVRPKSPVLSATAFLGLSSLSPLIAASLGVETACTIGFLSESVGFIFGAPSLIEAKNSFELLSDDDFAIFRKAVELSCGNPWGLCPPSEIKTFHMDELVDALSTCKGKPNRRSIEKAVDHFFGQINSLRPSNNEVVEVVEKEIGERLVTLAHTLDDLDGLSKSLETLSGLSKPELRKRCKKTIKAAKNKGFFTKEKAQSGHVYKYCVW